MKPIWEFKPYGQCGKLLSEIVAPLGDVVDEMAFVHNLVGKTGVHSQGTYLQATGFDRPGFPGMGCWVSYGLGSMNENLPTFVVLPDHRGLASNGTKNWDAAFLPAQHQGTVMYPGTEDPIADLFPGRAGTTTSPRQSERPASPWPTQSRTRWRHAPATSGWMPASAATSWRPACSWPRPRRSTSPGEPAHVLQAVRPRPRPTTFAKEINPLEETDYFGRKCLVARRLLERGVRFVQIWSGNDNGFPRRNWDSHEDIERDHGPLASAWPAARRP